MPARSSATLAADTDATTPSLQRTIGRYALRYGTTGVALAAASIAASATSASADEGYEVRNGDTVSQIARDTGTSAQAIRSANSLDAQYRIRAGQTLTIPSGTSATSAPAATPTAAPAGSHTVVAGDTVSAIARATGSSTSAIVSANGLDARGFIRIGQTLTIPGAGAAAPTVTTVSSVSPPVQATSDEPLVGDTFLGRTYSRDVVSAANDNKATLNAMAVPSKADMQAMVRSTARAHGVDPALALAIATQESGFDQRAVSPANAIGTMQVIPSSGDWASDMVGRDLNLLDPQDNVTAGVAILARLLATSPSVDTAIAGYYQGQTSVRNNGMFDDTRRYVANVQTLANQYR